MPSEGSVRMKFWRWDWHSRWVTLVIAAHWWRSWFVTLRLGRWIFTVDVSR